jgi:hypothetical protein
MINVLRKGCQLCIGIESLLLSRPTWYLVLRSSAAQSIHMVKWMPTKGIREKYLVR